MYLELNWLINIANLLKKSLFSAFWGSMRNKQIILVGFGKTSQPFAEKVRSHLEGDFGFRVFMPDNLPELRACFLDNETRLGRPAKELNDGTYKDRIVYIIQDTRIYDNRLVNISEEIEKIAEKIDDPELLQASQKLTLLTKPAFDRKTSPFFSSIEHMPDRIIRKLHGIIDFVKDAGAMHVGLAFRKSSYEWSHNHDKSLKEKDLWEMFTLKQVLKEFAAHGASSIIYVHPHAPQQGLPISRENRLNYVNINPQNNSFNNQQEVNLEEFFKGLNVKKDFLYPFDTYLSSRQIVKNEYDPKTTIIVSPDEGALKNTAVFAKRNSLPLVCSFKSRIDEGQARIAKTDDINDILDRIKQDDPNEIITFIILDDKINTAGTANNEAVLRIKQVEEYNRDKNTSFKAKIELWCTHFRNPYVVNLKHENLSKIVVLDTVPYIPSLYSQLKVKGLMEKFRILHGASYQVAAGIALDYSLNTKERQEELDS